MTEELIIIQLSEHPIHHGALHNLIIGCDDGQSRGECSMDLIANSSTELLK